MFKKLLIMAAAYLLLLPVLFSEMTPGVGAGSSGQGTGSGAGPQGGGSHQGKTQAAVPAKKDNVNDILTFMDKLELTSQQVVSIRLISADAAEEAAGMAKATRESKREFEDSLDQIKPDFAYIHKMLNEFTEAQAKEQSVPVDAYEKAYALLTDDQKLKLAFFRTIRQEEIDKNAADAAPQREQKPPPPISNPSTITH